MTQNVRNAVFAGIDLLDEGVGLFDSGYRLVYCNPAFRSQRGYPDEICVPGATLQSLLGFGAGRGDFGDGDPEAIAAALFARIDAEDDSEVEREMGDGRRLSIRHRKTPNGELMVTCRDRTDERRAEEALKRSEERYALVSEAADQGPRRPV